LIRWLAIKREQVEKKEIGVSMKKINPPKKNNGQTSSENKKSKKKGGQVTSITQF
jgi:hypothetical protein